MVGDCAFREMQGGCDFRVGGAAGDVNEHFVLTARQASWVGKGGSPRAARHAEAKPSAFTAERACGAVRAETLQRRQRAPSCSIVAGECRERSLVGRLQRTPVLNVGTPIT